MDNYTDYNSKIIDKWVEMGWDGVFFTGCLKRKARPVGRSSDSQQPVPQVVCTLPAKQPARWLKAFSSPAEAASKCPYSRLSVPNACAGLL